MRNDGSGQKGARGLLPPRGRAPLSKVAWKEKEGWRRWKDRCLSFDLQRRPRAEKGEECERLRHAESSSLAPCVLCQFGDAGLLKHFFFLGKYSNCVKPARSAMLPFLQNTGKKIFLAS